MVLDLCILLSWFRQDFIFHLRKQCYEWSTCIWSYGFKLKTSWFVHYKHVAFCFTRHLFWWHPFIVEGPMVSKWCKSEEHILCSPNLFRWRNKLIYILYGLRLSNFGVNSSFKAKKVFKIIMQAEEHRLGGFVTAGVIQIRSYLNFQHAPFIFII